MDQGSEREELCNTEEQLVTRPRHVLLRALEYVRSSVCCYQFSAAACDCKYGADGVGERTGCPELREVAALLRVMHEQEFVTMQRRVGAPGSVATPQACAALCELCVQEAREAARGQAKLCTVGRHHREQKRGTCSGCGRNTRLVANVTAAGLRALRDRLRMRAGLCDTAQRQLEAVGKRVKGWATEHTWAGAAEGLEQMSPQEVCETSVRTGIHHQDGTLTEAYGGEPRELPEEERRQHQEARAYVRSMTPEEAREFLVDGGFINRDGSLTARYGGQKE